EPFDFAFEFRYEFVGQTDRLRFVVSSLAIDYFDFHTLIFNHPTGKQKEFFILATHPSPVNALARAPQTAWCIVVRQTHSHSKKRGPHDEQFGTKGNMRVLLATHETGAGGHGSAHARAHDPCSAAPEQ